MMNAGTELMPEAKSRDLRSRTKAYALRIIRVYSSLPKRVEAQVIGKQMLDSGTSVGAHYREATRARSDAEFISKIEGGLQELEETIYWLELLADAEIVSAALLQNLFDESNEIAAMMVSSVKTTKERIARTGAVRSRRNIREETVEYSSFITHRSSLIITVFGGARVPADAELYAESLKLGKLLAQAGYVVATGGYTGTMEAVLCGAAEAGAHTIGYTCSTFEANFQPNGWVKEERKTAALSARIQRMADESDAFVVVHGGLGTLAELALVWNMMLAGETRARPFVVVGPEWPRVIDVLRAETQLGSSALKLLTFVDSVEEVPAVLAGQPDQTR